MQLVRIVEGSGESVNKSLGKIYVTAVLPVGDGNGENSTCITCGKCSESLSILHSLDFVASGQIVEAAIFQTAGLLSAGPVHLNALQRVCDPTPHIMTVHVK